MSVMNACIIVIQLNTRGNIRKKETHRESKYRRQEKNTRCTTWEI